MKRAQSILLAIFLIAVLTPSSLFANQGQGPTLDIYQAASRGALDQVNLHIAAGTDLNKPDEYGMTPLVFAVDSHRTEVVKRLLESGANPNTTSRLGPPLVRAAAQAYLDIVELLLANRADANIKDNSGRTALLAAAERRDKDMVELLVANGADVNAADNGGRTPLTLARRDEEISNFLRQNGAQEPVNTYDRYGPYGEDGMPGGTTEPGTSGSYLSNLREPDVLDDPNAIRAKIAGFPGLAEALAAIDANAASEERSWASRRSDNRSTLIRTVARQVASEMAFLKGIATEERAVKTVAAIDALSAKRTQRYDLIGADLREQRRLAQQDARMMTGRGRGRSAGRGSRGRMSRSMAGDAYGDSSMMDDPYGGAAARGAPRGRMPRSLPPAAPGPYGAAPPPGTAPGPRAEDVPEEPLDPETTNQLNAWLGADYQDKRDLLSAVHTTDLLELGLLREVAMTEEIAKPKNPLKAIVGAVTQSDADQETPPADVGAKKTTAAIEGLMLARQGRLDRIMAKMAADDERLQRAADRYGTTQTQMPTRGRRGRGRMPQQPGQPMPRRGRR